MSSDTADTASPGLLRRAANALGLGLPPVQPPSAPTPDLREQLEEHRAAVGRARAEVERLQLAYDDSGSPEDLARLREAHEAALLIERALERAERLHRAGLEREQADARAKLEARRAELIASLDPAALRAERAPLEEAEIAAFVRAAEARVSRRELERRIMDRKVELRRVQDGLGVPAPGFEAAVSFYNSEPSRFVISEALEERSRSAARPLADYLAALARSIRDAG